MSIPAARKGDQHNCPKDKPIPHRDGTIIGGSPNVIIEGNPAARTGDKIQCEDGSTTAISPTAACVLINGKSAARLNDPSSHDGKIISSAGCVFIADGELFVELGDNGIIDIGENVFFGT